MMLFRYAVAVVDGDPPAAVGPVGDFAVDPPHATESTRQTTTKSRLIASRV